MTSVVSLCQLGVRPRRRTTVAVRDGARIRTPILASRAGNCNLRVLKSVAVLMMITAALAALLAAHGRLMLAAVLYITTTLFAKAGWLAPPHYYDKSPRPPETSR